MVFRPDFSAVVSPDDSPDFDLGPGDVLWIPRLLYEGEEDREGHPFTVVRRPTLAQPYASVSMRTTRPQPEGTAYRHAARPDLGLDRQGWFLPPQFIQERALRRDNGVEYWGSLPTEDRDGLLAFVRGGLM